MWISIDGIEGSGKSAVATLLAEELGIELVPEFSQSRLGLSLRHAMDENPFEFSNSRLARSLFFMADSLEQYDTFIMPLSKSGKVVLSDRGYLSKYSYQLIALTDRGGEVWARQCIHTLMEVISPPDITIYLTCGIEVIKSRLEGRFGSVPERRLTEFSLIDSVARQQLASNVNLRGFVVDSSQKVRTTADQIKAQLKAWDIEI